MHIYLHNLREGPDVLQFNRSLVYFRTHRASSSHQSSKQSSNSQSSNRQSSKQSSNSQSVSQSVSQIKVIIISSVNCRQMEQGKSNQSKQNEAISDQAKQGKEAVRNDISANSKPSQVLVQVRNLKHCVLQPIGPALRTVTNSDGDEIIKIGSFVS